MAEQVQAPTNILASLLPQKAGTRSETVTEKTDLSPDAINELIRNMMEGDSGLAALLQGQAGKGLYNSTTAQLLANDLAARVAGKAALASAPKTTTSSVKSTMKGESRGVDPKMAAGLKLLEAFTSKLFGQQPIGGARGAGAGGTTQANAGFQNLLDTVLGRKSKQGQGGMSTSFEGMFPGVLGNDFSGTDFFTPTPLGFTGSGGRGDSFGSFSPLITDFMGGGFGSGGFDSLSFGLGGGGFDYNPFSLTAGGTNEFALGNTFGGNSNNFADSFSSGVLSGGSGASSFDWGPVDYGFSSGFNDSWF